TERREEDLLTCDAEIPLRAVEFGRQRAVEGRRELSEILCLRRIREFVIQDPERTAGKFCNQHMATVAGLSQKWETSPKTVTPASITATLSGFRLVLPISGR